MTTGELKKLLADVPDDRPIKIDLRDGPGGCELDIVGIDPRDPAVLLQSQYFYSEHPEFRWHQTTE